MCGSGFKTRDRHCSNNVNMIECPWTDKIDCTGFEKECPLDNLFRSGIHSCYLRTHRCEGFGLI